ncbi:MAG TPA: hypothetical protein VK892_22300 [Pyrinomonadaceae bacterium]|nr:hypothetical protein [Pyrinomonadaceae bacterium]
MSEEKTDSTSVKEKQTSTSPEVKAEPLLPYDLKEKIVSIGKPLTDSSQIDDYEKLEKIRNRSQKLQIILKTWETQQTEERNMRKTYAKWLLIALFAQIVLINTIFFFIGFGLMTVERWVATTFIIAVFFEISALLLVVVNYLFPKVGSELITLLEKV